MAKIEKLSQAIRLGSALRPQCKGNYFIDGKSCALGAAYEVLTGVSTSEDYEKSENPFAERLFNQMFDSSHELLAEITRRNDILGHTREEIAD